VSGFALPSFGASEAAPVVMGPAAQVTGAAPGATPAVQQAQSPGTM
jgi:hypothetical protein